jgi:ubiquitin-protein ligase E3 C
MSTFSTFSGTSRKTRNVNLSGQRNTNPWAASTWSPASNSGASKTVAQAQAEREKRHRERQELGATKRLQRVWRGHRSRQLARQTHRHDFDALYTSSVSLGPLGRVKQSFPLLLALFDSANHDDQLRLDTFVRDLTSLGQDYEQAITSGLTTWDRLAQLLVRALERYDAATPCRKALLD